MWHGLPAMKPTVSKPAIFSVGLSKSGASALKASPGKSDASALKADSRRTDGPALTDRIAVERGFSPNCCAANATNGLLARGSTASYTNGSNNAVAVVAIAVIAAPKKPKGGSDMTFSRTLKGALLALFAACSLQAQAWIRSPATTFAILPAGTAHPEGIAADAHGNLYVANFDISNAPGPGNIIVFSHSGTVLRKLDVAGSSGLLLGIAFHPQTGALLVIDLGNQKVLQVDPNTGAASPFADIPGGAAAGPNALAFDSLGDVYVSDSFQGKIWKTGATGGAPAEWLADPLLTTAGVPPFGANGMAFNKAGTALLVANTGNDTIVRIPISGGVAGTPTVFVNSINGADGLLVDDDDNIWVAANQADEIVVLNPSGKVIAKLGDFEGIDPSGSPVGLLFPASLALSNGFLYVTNLSLDLRLFNLPQTIDSQWAASVTRHTIARIKAQVPPVRGK